MPGIYRSTDASLADRVVIVSGGGRGLGRQMALSLVASGARVVLTGARSATELEQAQAEAEEIGGPECCRSLLADVTSEADCTQVVATAIDAFGTIYGLINNAGRGMRLISETFNTQPARFWESDPAAWRTIVDINVNGTFLMARAVAPHLVERGAGMIVNVSTSPVTMTRRGYSPYGPSKAALEACSASWARDFDGTGVCVNVLLPGGATDTALLPGSGRRFVAKYWQPGMSAAEGVAAALQPEVASPAIT